MYNIVRHLVEGREGIETFNLYYKTEHLNASANQIRTSSLSVCFCFCVCVCVCLLFPQLWLWFRLLLFSFSFLHRIRFVFVFAFMLVLVFFGSLILVLLRLCFSSRFLRVCFQYYFISLLQVLCTSYSSFPVLFFCCCVFVLCYCLYCGIFANNFTTAWVHKTSVEFDGWILFNAAGGRAQGLLFLPE